MQDFKKLMIKSCNIIEENISKIYKKVDIEILVKIFSVNIVFTQVGV